MLKSSLDAGIVPELARVKAVTADETKRMMRRLSKENTKQYAPINHTSLDAAHLVRAVIGKSHFVTRSAFSTHRVLVHVVTLIDE